MALDLMSVEDLGTESLMESPRRSQPPMFKPRTFVCPKENPTERFSVGLPCNINS